MISSTAFQLDGLHALITGGASGIGEATAKELVRAGAFVWITDINLPAAEALAESLGKARAVRMDVTSADSIASAAALLPQLDILVTTRASAMSAASSPQNPTTSTASSTSTSAPSIWSRAACCRCCWPARPRAASSTSARSPA